MGIWLIFAKHKDLVGWSQRREEENGKSPERWPGAISPKTSWSSEHYFLGDLGDRENPHQSQYQIPPRLTFIP